MIRKMTTFISPALVRKINGPNQQEVVIGFLKALEITPLLVATLVKLYRYPLELLEIPYMANELNPFERYLHSCTTAHEWLYKAFVNADRIETTVMLIDDAVQVDVFFLPKGQKRDLRIDSLRLYIDGLTGDITGSSSVT